MSNMSAFLAIILVLLFFGVIKLFKYDECRKVHNSTIYCLMK